MHLTVDGSLLAGASELVAAHLEVKQREEINPDCCLFVSQLAGWAGLLAFPFQAALK